MKIQYLHLGWLWLLTIINPLLSQSKLEVLNIRSSGQTTGLILEMDVRNTADVVQTLAPMTYYIPSDGSYQRYVGRIQQPQRIEPKQTKTIALQGYCADISKPPVPQGLAGSPFSKWIAISIPETTPSGLVNLLPQRVRSPWQRGSIPNPSPFQLGTSSKKSEEQNWFATWPGTDTPIGGVVNPDANPAATAPFLVAILEQIERATYDLQQSGSYRTPYGANPRLEATTITQHSFWLAIAVLTGNRYSRQDFRNNILAQLGATPELALNGLTNLERNNAELGINDFWDSFEAVGSSAKVISNRQGPSINTTSSNTPTDPCKELEAPAAEAERKCKSIDCRSVKAQAIEIARQLEELQTNLNLVRQNLIDWDQIYRDELNGIASIISQSQLVFSSVGPYRQILLASLKKLYRTDTGEAGLFYEAKDVLSRGGRYLEVYPGIFIERDPSNNDPKAQREAYVRNRIENYIQTKQEGPATRQALDNYLNSLEQSRNAEATISQAEAREIELKGQRKALEDAIGKTEFNINQKTQQLQADQANYDACTAERIRLCDEANRLYYALKNCRKN